MYVSFFAVPYAEQKKCSVTNLKNNDQERVNHAQYKVCIIVLTQLKSVTILFIILDVTWPKTFFFNYDRLGFSTEELNTRFFLRSYTVISKAKRDTLKPL